MATKTLPKKSAPKSRTKKPDCPINNVQQYAEGTTPITAVDLAEMLFSYINKLNVRQSSDHLFCQRIGDWAEREALYGVTVGYRGQVCGFFYDRQHSDPGHAVYGRKTLIGVEIIESVTQNGETICKRVCTIDKEGVIVLSGF